VRRSGGNHIVLSLVLHVCNILYLTLLDEQSEDPPPSFVQIKTVHNLSLIKITLK
jgi:hypothetical protein